MFYGIEKNMYSLKTQYLNMLAIMLVAMVLLPGFSYAQEGAVEIEVPGGGGFIQSSDFDVFTSSAVPQEVQDVKPSISFTGAKPVGDDFSFDNMTKGPASVRIPSLFFTANEHAQIIKSKNARGFVRAPTSTELDNGAPTNVLPGERNINLGGIVYKAKDDWIIWLNSRRITPKALPKEALELRVFRDYIEIRWYDEYTNKIYPLRMRSHQRFNLDARIFLPG